MRQLAGWMNNRPISGLQKEETEENLREIKLSQVKSS